MKFNVDDLVEKGLVKKKTYTEGKYKGLSILKYSRKVFYNNLWNTDSRLLDCRGRVVDEEDNIIVNNFTKVFNLHENGTEVDPEKYIIAPRKVNGFLGCVTNTEKYGVIYSTTGSLDSDYVKCIEKHVPEIKALDFPYGLTFMFEICDEDDPHIVEEVSGAYLIGIRTSNGLLLQEGVLEVYAKWHGLKRPEVWKGKFKNLPATQMEGYMVREANTSAEKVLCKIKSPHYLSKKMYHASWVCKS